MSQSKFTHNNSNYHQQSPFVQHQQADILDLQTQVKDLQLRLRECRLKHKQEKDQLRIRFDLQQIRLEKDLHLKAQFKIKEFREDVKQNVEEILKSLSDVTQKQENSTLKKELQEIALKLEGLAQNVKMRNEESQFLIFQDLNQDTQLIGSIFNYNEDEEDQALLQELENNQVTREKGFQQRKQSEPHQNNLKIQEDTLNLTNYSDQNPKIPMPKSKESIQIASESASVNQAMIYSEQSLPHILSSVSISRKDETCTQQLTREQLLKRQLEYQISQIDSKMTLSDKEKLLCNIYSKNFLDRAGLQDVKPEEVLKTFTNSIEPSLRSLARQNIAQDEISTLSPIRNLKEKRDVVNEIQKIAKEIKRIPTQDFKTEEFLKTSQNQSFDEEDSLLQELGKLSSKEQVGIPYQPKGIVKQTSQNGIEEKHLQDYIDVPFQKVVSSIDSFKQLHQKSNGEIRIKQNNLLQHSRGGSKHATGMQQDIKNLTQNKPEDKNMVLNQNSSGQLVDMKSPFQVQSQSVLEQSNINDSDINFADQQNNKHNLSNKLNIKKNQIRFNNLNSFVQKHRGKQQQDTYQLQNQNQPLTNNQGNYLAQGSHQVNNNFIELNNSVIILQKNSRETSPLASQLMENLVIDRPFTEMRKIKHISKSNNYSLVEQYQNKQQYNSGANQKFGPYQHQLSQNQPTYQTNHNLGYEQNAQHMSQQQQKKSQMQSNQMSRRLNNVSVQEHSYQYQQHLKVQSPNMSLNSSQKRAQSSLNNSKVLGDLSSYSPYVLKQQPLQQPQQQQLQKQPIKMIKIGSKGKKLQQKALNLSNNNSTNQEISQRQQSPSVQNQPQPIRMIKKGILNKVIQQTSNANISTSKIKLTDIGGGKLNALAKATNKYNRIQPQ